MGKDLFQFNNKYRILNIFAYHLEKNAWKFAITRNDPKRFDLETANEAVAD